MLSQEVLSIPITRPPYSPEFRQQAIDLARAGRDPVSLSKGARANRGDDPQVGCGR